MPTCYPIRECDVLPKSLNDIHGSPLQLENWSNARSRKTPEVDLLVPPGQLPIGEALIKAMYEKKPDLSALSQQQQLQLLQLADAYSVHKVSFAACSSLSSLSEEGIDMATAVAIFDLPGTCKQLKPYSSLKEAAAGYLQEQFGDLEIVWGGVGEEKEQLQQQLLGLSFSALYQLLSDERTKVASEDTIYYTVARWLKRTPEASTKEKQQLAEVIRLPLCTPTYLTTVICGDAGWIRSSSAISNQDLFKACALSASKEAEGSTLFATAGFKENVPAFKRYPSWALPHRPWSSVEELEITWNVPLSDLQAAFEAALSSKPGKGIHSPASPLWQGKRFSCRLAVGKVSEEGSFQVSMYLDFANGSRSKGHELCIEAELWAEKEGSDAVPLVHTLKASALVAGMGRGFTDFLRLGKHGSWETVEQQLRSKGFVHADGSLHLGATVYEIA